MPSAWDLLEDKVYDTMTAIVAVDLGNVWRFRPEHEHSGRLGAYYYADVSGAQTVRAWCVFVRQALDFDTQDTTTIRLECTVTAWYAKGVGGAGVQTLKEHVSQVQGALKALGVSLGGVVSLIEDWGLVEYRSEPNPVDRSEGDVIVAEWSFTCRRGMSDA